MQITDVRVRKVTKEGKMKAVVSITLDNEFVVHDIKVIEGERDYLLLCRAGRRLTENTGISPIRLIQKQGSEFRALFWRNMK